MTDEVDVRAALTDDQLQRYAHAEYECFLAEHEGASFHTIFDHDHYGYIGFSVHTCPGDCDVRVAYTEWEQEPHHELADRMVWVRKDGESDA